MRFNTCFVCGKPAKTWTRDPWHPENELGFCSADHYQRQTAMWKAGQDVMSGVGDSSDALRRLKELMQRDRD
jgi:hypothetical protein